MFTVEKMYEANPEFQSTLFADSKFLRYINKHLHDSEYRTIFMQRTALSEEQTKLLSELKSQQNFIDWKYTENPQIQIKNIDNPVYQRYLIDEYIYYKKSWLGKIKFTFSEFNNKLYEQGLTHDFNNTFQGLQDDISEILFSNKKIDNLISKYFTQSVINAANASIEMKRSLTASNLAWFLMTHTLFVVSMPTFIVISLILTSLFVIRAVVTSIMINTYFSIMALNYFFNTKSNNNNDVEKTNALSKFLSFIARGLINLLKFTISIAIPLMGMTWDIFIILAVSTPYAIVNSLLSPRNIFRCYTETHKLLAEQEVRKEEKKNDYNKELQRYAANNESDISALFDLVNNKEDGILFLTICDVANNALKTAPTHDTFKHAYTAINTFSGAIQQLKNNSEIHNHKLISIIKDSISEYGPLASNASSIKDACALNDAQRESIVLLNKVFDSILRKGYELFPDQKPAAELPQPSTMINSFKILRKSQPEHVTMVPVNEEPLNLHVFQLTSSTRRDNINNTDLKSNNYNTRMLLNN